MIELTYQLLEKVGFTHPLHPAITHLPMGMIMGAFIFQATSIVLKKTDLEKTAFYCIVVALIFVFPTMLLGFMDWWAKFEAEWSNLILIKFVLAGILTALLAFSYVSGKKGLEGNRNKMMVLYTLCLFTAIGLGFTGGEIQYG